MNLKLNFVRDEIETGRLSTHHIESKYMSADFLTKAVTKDKLEWTLNQISLLDINDQEGNSSTTRKRAPVAMYSSL